LELEQAAMNSLKCGHASGPLTQNRPRRTATCRISS